MTQDDKKARFAITTAEGRALALLFALPGVIAGLLVWFIAEELTSDHERLAAFLLPLVIFGTGAWTLATEPGNRARALVFAGLVGLGLGALSWSAFGRYDDDGYVQGLLMLPLLGWIALSFYRAGPTDYRALFAAAWNLPVVLVVAQAFAWGAYGLLWLLGAMFGLIGLPILTDALREGAVSMPLTGALMAAGIAVVRRQEAILLSLRTVLFALLRVLAPVFAFGTALFSVALLFQGLDALWAGWSPVILLVSTLTAGVVFVNAIVQDGEAPGGLLGWTARLQAMVLPVLAALALYGMGLRIGEHGLTPQRIIAALIAGFAMAYATAYAVSGLFARWGWLRRANVGLAIALSGVIAFTMTPLFRAQEWSVADQMARLNDGRVSAEAFDYAALRFDLGQAGRTALERLAQTEGAAADRAQAALDAEYRYEIDTDDDQMAAKDAYMTAALVRPSGATLPPDIAQAVRNRLYPRDMEAAEETIFLVMMDFDGDRDAVLWARRRDDRTWVEIQLFIPVLDDAERPQGERIHIRDRSQRFPTTAAADAFMLNLREGSFGPMPITVIVPAVAGVPILPEPGRSGFIMADPPDVRPFDEAATPEPVAK